MALDVRNWLEGLGLGKYAETFVVNDVDFAVLAISMRTILNGLASRSDIARSSYAPSLILRPIRQRNHHDPPRKSGRPAPARRRSQSAVSLP